jgi:8-oxo-dGTP diphosphatase
MDLDGVQSITGIVFSEDRQKILLIKRRDVPVWVLPGGGIEAGESPEAALLREMEEETGLAVGITRLIALYDKGSFFVKKTLFYECHLLKNIPQKKFDAQNLEVKELKFFSLQELPRAIPPPYREFIQDAVANLPPQERAITSITLPLIVKTLFSHPVLLLRFLLARLGLPINT